MFLSELQKIQIFNLCKNLNQKREILNDIRLTENELECKYSEKLDQLKTKNNHLKIQVNDKLSLIQELNQENFNLKENL